MDNNVDIGDIYDDNSKGEEVDLNDEYTDDQETHTSEDAIDVESHNPVFEPKVTDDKSVIRCKTCGNRISLPSLCIDGECISCAKRHLRNIEASLVAVKAIKPKRKYCIMPDHPEVVPTPNHPDWNKITVFGIDFFPPADICPKCMLTLRTYFTQFLESRGILREGQGHAKNIWLPYSSKQDPKAYLKSVELFREFMLAADLHCKDSNDGTDSLFNQIKTITESINKKEVEKSWKLKKSMKEAQKKMYPALNEEDAGLQLKAPSLEVLKKTADQLLKSLKPEMAAYSVFLSPEAEEQRRKELLKLFKNNRETKGAHQNLKVMENLYPEIMKTLREEAEYALGPHAAFADDAIAMALNAYEAYLSSLQ